MTAEKGRMNGVFYFWSRKKSLTGKRNMHKNTEPTKQSLIKAFDRSKSKSVADMCRIAGVSRVIFYYHCKNDETFRRQIITKKAEHLTKLAAA